MQVQWHFIIIFFTTFVRTQKYLQNDSNVELKIERSNITIPLYVYGVSS
jgi:hypothetical protein